MVAFLITGCAPLVSVGAARAASADPKETPDTTEEMQVPNGFMNKREGLAYRIVEPRACVPSESVDAYVTCWTIEVVALRDCSPAPVDAMVRRASDFDLLANMTGELPEVMSAGDHQIVDLQEVWSEDPGDVYLGIQGLRCVDD